MARDPSHKHTYLPLTSHIVPFAATVKDGEVFKVECVDWTGGQIGNNDSADDMKNIDLTKIHYLSGPFEVQGAEPGDILVVEIQDVQPFQEQPWGFTGVFDKDNGGGFLDEIYPNAYVFRPTAVLSRPATDRTFTIAPRPSGTSKAFSARRVTSLICDSPASYIQAFLAALPPPKSSPSGTAAKRT